ncbi:nickel/cobalt efflux system [Tersicoccus solisilvae]|uniref:Nickel/cobalt efflux system n=1 Tax=Tersicoccus solisilvae TaxID=1882339 RepID=A0ABQ1NTX6_9MICC|nr:hypothetical protein [Tersicoccus solisilvae]GGC83912.1 nickel/cobalt efflux system [Tersicoccus solisilvae]
MASLAPAASSRALLPVVVAIGVLTALGAATLGAAAVTAPGSAPTVLGLGVTCWLLGARHALDADHIAAIDNTTRRLLDRSDGDSTGTADAGRPRAATTGFWFALGHSTVVFAAVVLITAGVAVLRDQLADDGSPLGRFTGVWGPLVSSAFLLLIAVLNLRMLAATRRALGTDGDRVPAPAGGPLTRLFAAPLRRIDTPRAMYPVGLLFGLGFDTATTIGLIVIAAGSAALLPAWAALALPVVFAAGMTLVDTLDAVLMERAYGWALRDRRRRLTYNTVVTGVSILAAVGVAAVTLAALGTELLGDVPVLGRLAAVDLQYAGVALVGFFAVAFAVTLLRTRTPT